MLGLFKGKTKGNFIYAPCKGEVVALEDVPDPAFSEKVLGDGFAVIPAEGKIYAPADGEVTMVFDASSARALNLRQP
ncbi:pTS system beta-glucosides-specific IIA component / PTS system beta-glucosides-specific IIB component / PTS system beta-glucosides-specific IIC component [Firmicutes bacterium CAG:791]|nr:pTS system beta-glucosides-specific IIA component / PTS system beta-glucosides-specific IIB component / PTS system beta-glucosides-specific IIC component [Firmicutes bacterium CAG:791]